MTTEQTAQQLELAAQIIRTGHPFEVRHDASDRWHASLETLQKIARVFGRTVILSSKRHDR